MTLKTKATEHEVEKAMEEVKAKYPELFAPQIGSELDNRYGEGKYFDGEAWSVRLGGLYSLNSSQRLMKKTASLLGGDVLVRIPPLEDRTGWIFAGKYDKNHKTLYGNIKGYPVPGKRYEFVNKKFEAYNVRETPPKTIASYYKDLEEIGVVWKIRRGRCF